MKKTILFLVMAVALTTQTLFAQVPSYVPTNGLVGYWPFSGNANDESGNGYNGVVNGPTLTVDRFGSPNSAYSFDGINDFIQAPNYASNSSFTVSCWVNMPTYNLNSLGSNDFIFFGNHSGINDLNRNFLIGYRNFGSEYGFSTYIFNDNGINTFQSYPINQTPPSVNSWHHFVSVFENGTYVKMYLDNVLFWTQASNISQQTTRPSEPLFFGIGVATQYDFLNGKLDDVGFWNRALTETEITNLYNSSLPQTACLPANIPTTGLVGYWPFCGNANDESDNGNNGTNNGATLTTDRFGNSNSAYYFSSSGCATRIDAQINTSSIQSGLTISLWVNKLGDGCINPRVFEFYSGSGGPTDAFMIWSNNGTTDFGSITSTNTFVSTSFIPEPNNVWFNLVYTNDGLNGKFYKNGILFHTEPSSGTFSLNGNLAIGRMNHPSFDAFNGKIDDFGIWNRALTQEEITNLYNVNQCITNITVTDTLIINVGQLSFNDPVTWANNITIAPNPASSQININFNNITNLNGGTLKIINSLGQEVATTPITTSGTNSTMQLATWGGTGMYFVQIINPQGQIVDIKKIILQ